MAANGKGQTEDLFTQAVDSTVNLLPYDGTVNYFGQILDSEAADHYFTALMREIDWRHDEAVMFGKRIVTRRKVAWYAGEPFAYTYSRTTKIALPWTSALQEMKTLVETCSGEAFNACLLNLYHDGSEGMAWHSDDEKALKPGAAIGSLSLGAERKFAFKHKDTKETVSRVLENGSLLIMKNQTQRHWLHRLPPTKRISTPRINLTFRSMV